jgi:radical SAM protein with 4Fe4S-binding SPASM domain
MIDRAKSLWNLRQATISLDGTEETYNRVKSFPNVNGNPYQRMMQNVEIMLKKDIMVALRMNYDKESYGDFAELLEEAKQRFPENVPLMVYPHQINWDYPEEERETIEAWFNDTNVKLDEMTYASGLDHRGVQDLPFLTYKMCGAVNGQWFAIRPDGQLVCCGEQLDDDSIIGNIRQGVTNKLTVKAWKHFDDNDRCVDCELFPLCAKLKNCRTKDRCYHKKGALSCFEKQIRSICDLSVSQDTI